jgi:hypothetical protein
MGEHANEECYRDGENHKQPNVIENSDQFSMGHMEGNFSPRVLDHRMTAKFKIDFRLFAISEVERARTKGEDEKGT